MTKATLGVGGVLFLISTAAIVIGGVSLDNALSEDSMNPHGDEYWTGNTPTTFSGELKWDSYYYVFVEEGRSVSVEVIDGDEYSRFMPCEEDNSCDFFYEPGYTYVGTGSGYQAAVLCELGANVFSIERQGELYKKAISFLPSINYYPKKII